MYNLMTVTTPNNKAHNRYVISQVSCTAQDQTETLHNSQLLKLKLSLVGFNKLFDKPSSL